MTRNSCSFLGYLRHSLHRLYEVNAYGEIVSVRQSPCVISKTTSTYLFHTSAMWYVLKAVGLKAAYKGITATLSTFDAVWAQATTAQHVRLPCSRYLWSKPQFRSALWYKKQCYCAIQFSLFLPFFLCSFQNFFLCALPLFLPFFVFFQQTIKLGLSCTYLLYLEAIQQIHL
jgi:hypothetical protein